MSMRDVDEPLDADETRVVVDCGVEDGVWESEGEQRLRAAALAEGYGAVPEGATITRGPDITSVGWKRLRSGVRCRVIEVKVVFRDTV